MSVPVPVRTPTYIHTYIHNLPSLFGIKLIARAVVVWGRNPVIDSYSLALTSGIDPIIG